MDFASIQAQLANLTSQLSQYAEGTTMQSVPTFGASCRQGYQVNQCPQRDWSNHSTSMWWEARQVQHEAYWQPYEEFYSQQQPPQPYAQPNSGSTIDCNQILDELISLFQGSQNQANEAQHETYWQSYEEFYTTPMQPPPHPPQQVQSNSSMSVDSDQILQLLTSLTQDQQNQDKKLGELENQMGEIMEFMAQIQEQSERSNSTIENSKEEFEIHDAITLGSAMEVGAIQEPSKHSLKVDELLLQEEEEEDDMGSLEELLPQAPQVTMPSNLGEVVPNSIHSNIIPPNAPFPCRFLISKKDESEQDIMEALPKVQVAGEHVECIKEDVVETTNAKEVEFDDTGQAPTIIVNMAKFKVPETFKEVVFSIEFVSEQKGKPSSLILISFYTNLLLILMIQAPTLEFKPLPDHFKYHLPFKDKFHASIVRLQDVKESASWEATHAFN